MSDPYDPIKIMIFTINDACCTSQANQDLTFEFVYADTTKKIKKTLYDKLLRNFDYVRELNSETLNSFVEFIINEGVIGCGLECGCGTVILISKVSKSQKMTTDDLYKF